MTTPSIGLDPALRRRVLQHRPAWRREDWEPIPIVSYSRPANIDDSQLQDDLKLYLRLFMTAVRASLPADGSGRQFVVLFRIERDAQGLTYRLICPYDKPLSLLVEAQRNRAVLAELAKRAIDLDIALRMGVYQDAYLPLVVTCDPAKREFAYDNHNHLSNPGQFLSPFLCQTTSGFLNFLGARDLRGSTMSVVNDLDKLVGRNCDEWIRWVLCHSETGVALDGARLLVHRTDRERWVYDYDG